MEYATILAAVITLLFNAAIFKRIDRLEKNQDEFITHTNVVAVAAEQSAKSAHHRIDGLEKRVNSLERR